MAMGDGDGEGDGDGMGVVFKSNAQNHSEAAIMNHLSQGIQAHFALRDSEHGMHSQASQHLMSVCVLCVCVCVCVSLCTIIRFCHKNNFCIRVSTILIRNVVTKGFCIVCVYVVVLLKRSCVSILRMVGDGGADVD